MIIDSDDLLARFLRYVQIDTRSDAHSATTPTTPGQWDLLRLLNAELTALGATEVTLTAHGYVLATIPATVTQPVPVMAWCAHVDTAPNLPGAATPLVHRAYAGQPIVLPDDPSQTLTLENTPLLRTVLGHDLITASGKTLLGADDKAGVATVMNAARHLLLHPEIPHGKIRLCFNPDEEVAAGLALAGILPEKAKPPNVWPERAQIAIQVAAGAVPAVVTFEDVRDTLQDLLPYWPKAAIGLILLSIGLAIWRMYERRSKPILPGS